MSTIVDTNILLDIVTADPAWMAWSLEALETATRRGPLIINAVIYAELSINFTDIGDLDHAVRSMQLDMRSIPTSALFKAGRAFRDYRRRGGTRTSVLPDFFIGAHADDLGIPVLTRDGRRFRMSFPDLAIIAP